MSNSKTFVEEINALSSDNKVISPYFIIFAHVIMEFYYRSQVIGMGFLQTKSDAYIFTALLASIMGESSKEEVIIDCDYLFGRMMKTTFIYNTITRRIIVKYNSNPEYSSWVFGDHNKQVKQYISDGILASFSYVGVLPQFSEEHIQKVIDTNS